MKRCIFCLIANAYGNLEKDHADDKEQGDHADAGVDVAGDLADGADKGGAHEGGAFAADIHNTKVFARLFWRNDACEIRARKGLDAALKHANENCQHPKLPLVRQENRKHSDAKIGDDTDGDEFCCGVAPG